MWNPKRTCYLTVDGKYYCYKRWDDNAKCEVTQRLEVGKDLQDRYVGELRDPVFDAKESSYKADPDNEDTVDPWDTLADKGGSPENVLFSEPETENPEAALVRKVIEENCTDAQRDLYYEHFGMRKQLEEIRQEEAERTEKLVSQAAMTKRKNKIIDKVAKVLGVSRIKRSQHNKK